MFLIFPFIQTPLCFTLAILSVSISTGNTILPTNPIAQRHWNFRQEKPTSSKSKKDPIKVMSFNIRYGSADDGKNHWKHRKHLVPKTIKRFSPDLLGTQETLGFQAKYLKKQLPEYKYIGWSREKNANGEQCGIFFRKVRFSCVKSGQFWLSKNPKSKFSKSWDSSLPRVACWAVLKDKKTREEMLFINTHFDHRGKTAREESALLISNWIHKNHSDKPVVITGDFNAKVDSICYRNLINENQFSDTFLINRQESQKGKKTGTFNGFKGTKTGKRIDWILTNDRFQTLSGSIDYYQDGGRYPSDHFPVTATIRSN